MVKPTEHIVADAEILGGKPVIKGTRISVAFVLQLLAAGMTVEDILKGYPHLKKEEVLAAIEYASDVLDGEEVIVSG